MSKTLQLLDEIILTSVLIFAFLTQAKQKYESDAMTINTMHAQAALIQGRDLDKVSIASTRSFFIFSMTLFSP